MAIQHNGYSLLNSNEQGGGPVPVYFYLAWCRTNKFKVIALLLILLILIQYLFGASIYNVKIFDYNISQIYIWNDASSKNAVSSNETNDFPRTSTVTTAAAPIADTNSGITAKAIRLADTNLTTIQKSSLAQNGSSSGQNVTKINSSNSVAENGVIGNNSLPFCPVLPPVLVGPIKVWFDYPSYEELEKLYPDLEPGGHGKPKDCISRHKVAIIIPYRDRDQHLRGFLHNMHSLLRKQQLDYAIIAVEQVENQTFNRAKLMNVGFAEAVKLYDWQCAIFHDVDLLPEDDRNIYSCPEQPRHMSVAVDKFNYRLPYSDIFGGISALTVEQFRTLNGFSNDYWGWGGEDDDMASRVKLHKYQISRYPAQIARYKMIKHVSDKENPVNPCRFNLMYKVKQRWKNDGLSTLNYEVISLEKKHLFTRILVDLKEVESKKRLDEEKVCASSKKKP